MDPRVEAVANVLTQYSIDLKPGQLVQIESKQEGFPLVIALYRAVLKAGGHPWLDLGIEDTQEFFYTHASEEQLAYYPEFLKQANEDIDASITI